MNKTYVRKLVENPCIEMPQVEPMYNFAKAKHDATGAIRKASGNPYFEHPSGVADLAVAFNGSDVEVEVALAHDVLEDTNTSFEEIAEQFGEEVAGYVAEITNDRNEIDVIGKENYINKELITISKPALFVKLLDMLYNTIDRPRDSQKQRMIRNIKYLKSHRDLDDREAEICEYILSHE